MNLQTENYFTIGRWTRATFRGWLLGVVFIIAFSSLLDSIGIEGAQFYLGLAGAGVGFTQWLLLKKFTTISRKWIWFSTTGMSIPFIVLDIVAPHAFTYRLPLGVVLGALLSGLLQFMILKHHSPKATVWIWGSVAGWTLAILAVVAVEYTKHLAPYVRYNLILALINLVLILSGGIILGIITGSVLKKILKGGSLYKTAEAIPESV